PLFPYTTLFRSGARVVQYAETKLELGDSGVEPGNARLPPRMARMPGTARQEHDFLRPLGVHNARERTPSSILLWALTWAAFYRRRQRRALVTKRQRSPVA